jgi:hypothetical protein
MTKLNLIDIKSLSDCFLWMWERIDSDTLLEHRNYIKERMKCSDSASLFLWSFNELDKQHQIKLAPYIAEKMVLDDTSMARSGLKIFKWGFKQGNHLAAWEAVKFCKEENLSLPKWANDYLYNVAEGLLAIKKPRKDTPRLVLKATKLRGKDFTGRGYRPEQDLSICSEVERLIEEGRTSAAAYRKYEQNTGAKVETIKKIHLTYRKHPLYPFLLSLLSRVKKSSTSTPFKVL